MKIGVVNWKIEKIVKKGDYLYGVVKEHPKANKYGYVLLHRLIMENHIERILNSNEIVHHKNYDKHDNRVENLEVMTSEQHAKMHTESVGRKWCELKCPCCGVTFHREYRQTFLAKPNASYTCCSRRCSGKFSRFIQLNGKTINVEKAISVNIVSEYRKYSHDNTEQTDDNQDA